MLSQCIAKNKATIHLWKKERKKAFCKIITSQSALDNCYVNECDDLYASTIDFSETLNK